MHISRLYIRNFRSIGEVDLILKPGKTVITGKNNSGKSNIVRALDLMLGESSPTWSKSENLTEADFRVTRDGAQADEIVIWCQLEKGKNESLNFSEINKCFGFNVWGKKGPLFSPHRVKAEDPSEAVEEIFSVNEDELAFGEKLWFDGKPKNTNGNSFQKILGDKTQFAFTLRATKNEKGIERELRFLMREDASKGWIMAFKASVRSELLQSAILPSFRDPALQLRLTPWTWYGKLMKHLTKEHTDSEKLRKAIADLNVAGNEFFDKITDDITDVALKHSFQDAHISFQFTADKPSDIYRSCVIYIDDGHKSLLTDKGAGVQSSAIIGLFSYYTKNVNATGSSLLCLEEPELFLHPHARRVVSDNLDLFLDGNRNQVIATTHSVDFIRTRQRELNLILVRKTSSKGTEAQSINGAELLDLLINNNQNELVFADSVILCEGKDEHVLRMAADELFPGELDLRNVSIISTESKDRLPLIAKLIVSMGIKCHILADFDFLLRDTKPKDEYKSAKCHKSLQELDVSIFVQPYIGATAGMRLLERIKSMRTKLRTENERAFYTGDDVSLFSEPGLLELTSDLRKAGIGVLNGQVEDLSRDHSLVKKGSKKLSKDSIYQLREAIAAGRKCSDIFDLRQFDEFLRPILGSKVETPAG